jgi:hypothetical protein
MIENIQSTSNVGNDEFIKGINYLKGINGFAKDDGIAIASLLDSSDLGNPEATFICSLLYFCGIGVERNIQIATEFSWKYLNLKPDGPYITNCKEIIDGSIGSHNALKLVYSFGPKTSNTINDFLISSGSVEGGQIKLKNRKIFIFLTFLITSLVTIGIIIFIPNLGGALREKNDTGQTKFFTEDELDQAKQKVFITVSKFKTEAGDLDLKDENDKK